MEGLEGGGVGFCRDCGANKREHIYHSFVISVPCTIDGVQPSQH